MKTLTVLLLAMCCAAQCTAAEELACDPDVVAGAWSLLAAARFGSTDHEQAAFITAGPGHVFIVWRDRQEFRRASFKGTRPADAIAIIHTHPNGRAFPSIEDEQTAELTNMPVYTVTRQMISRTDGHRVEVIWEGDWNPARPRASTVCQAGTIR